MTMQVQHHSRQALTLAPLLLPGQAASRDGCTFAFMLTNMIACLDHAAAARTMSEPTMPSICRACLLPQAVLPHRLAKCIRAKAV